MVFAYICLYSQIPQVKTVLRYWPTVTWHVCGRTTTAALCAMATVTVKAMKS